MPERQLLVPPLVCDQSRPWALGRLAGFLPNARKNTRRYCTARLLFCEHGHSVQLIRLPAVGNLHHS